MWEHLGDFDPRWVKTHRYALIDATLRDELPAAWGATVIAPGFLGYDTSRCPVLIDFQSLPAQERAAVIDRLAQEVLDRQETLCSLLMQSPIEALPLANHLAQRMLLRLPGDSTPKQFRFFDPGTFLQLPGLLAAAGMAWLLGPVQSVLVPWAGQWTRVNKPVHAGSFYWQPHHYEGLSRIGVINRAMLQHEPSPDGAAWMRACAALDATVQRAIDRHGLRRQNDLVAFAGHALQHHPRFDEHPRVQALLGRLKAVTADDEIDYQELTSALSAQDWQAICRDLPAADATPASSEGPRT